MARRPAATTRRAAAPRGRRKANTAPPQFGTHAYAVAFERVMRMVREASTPAIALCIAALRAKET
jgi:hypothetical protein